MDAKLISIIAVAVIVVAGVGGYVVLSGNDSGDDDNTESFRSNFSYDHGVRLAIFGNANGDDYINNDDVTCLQKLISGDLKADPVKNAYADTNADGKLDQADVDLLQKIIAGEKCTMYYWSCSKSIASIDYPLSGKIGTHHMYAIDALIILGLYDSVVATSHQTFQNSIAVDGIRYPGMGTTIADVGSPWEDCQAAVKAGCNVWIETGYSASRPYDTYKTIADKAGLNLQVVQLYVTTYNTQATEIYGSVLMLGVMFQKQTEAHKYVDWVDGVQSYIAEKKAAANTNATFITPMGTTDPGEISLDSTTLSGNMMGDVYTISLTGMTDVNVRTDSSCPPMSLEEIYDRDPNVIVIIMFQDGTKSISEVQEKFNEYAEIYKNTNAYKNKQIYGVNYYNIASCAGASELVLLSSYIWPDVFEESVGWEYLEYYYANFTAYKAPDVHNMGNAMPFKMLD